MDNSLFSEDIWDATIEESQENKGPVKVLGMEFANDDERRAYFREELRKKLPELRYIEGFPIGEDDDIINLSDPPYYTACPNPWINDIIQEWENEKQLLEDNGMRSSEFEVKEPYASDVSEGKNNPIYMAHAYHTKVPHPAIMRYILHYTQPGDIVFDGFCGTGMTGVAANLCGSIENVNALNLKNAKVGVRHSICSDLSPIASLISASYNARFDVKAFQRKAESILQQVDDELGWMYETKVGSATAKVNFYIWSDVFSCPECATEINLWKEAVNLNQEIIKDQFACPKCGTTCSKKNLSKLWETVYDKTLGKSLTFNKKEIVRVNYTTGKRYEVDPTAYDFELYNKCTSYDIPNQITSKLPDGEKTKSIYSTNHIEYLHHWFTRRNYAILSRVKELIGNDVILLTWFTSVLQNSSTMYKFRLDRKGGILNGTFFIPSLTIEQNPIRLLKAKIRDITNAFYETRGNSLTNISSATSLSHINDNSIDYIFVDPPFGANIMYSELNSIWEGWLKVTTNNSTEAIVSKEHNKSIFDYQDLMNSSFQEFYRILKPGKWATIEFSNTSAQVWNSIQNALQGVGFVLTNVAAIDKQQGSFNAVNSPTAVKQDLIITCFKPSDEFIDKFGYGESSHSIWDFVDEYLTHIPIHIEKNSSTTAVIERSPKILYDRLITYYVKKGLQVPIDAAAFHAGLRERYAEEDGMFFISSQLVEYREKKKNTSEFIPMGLIVSTEADGIEWLRNRLRVHGPQTYQQIQPEWMQAINGLRKNDILPELKDLLYENFIEEADGKWRLPNVQDDVDKAALRTKALLKEFKIYVEVAQKPKAKLKEVRVEAVRAGFKQCYIDKDFQTIVTVGDKIPQNLLTEDEILLQFYDIAINHV